MGFDGVNADAKFIGDFLIGRPSGDFHENFALPQGQGKRWSTARLATLEELPERDLEMDDDGWVTFEITPKKILTFEFVA